MNQRHIIQTGNSTKPSVLARAMENSPTGTNTAFTGVLVALMLFLLAASSAWAQQAVRSGFTQVRATVSVGTTNMVFLSGPNFTNSTTVNLLNGVTNVNFTVSGLPPSATAILVDVNTNALPSTTQDTN